jgi:hypothetical protein
VKNKLASTPPKKEKYDFEKMKMLAMHEDPSVRKLAFVEYFERFEEFPTFLFDNEQKVDERLRLTIDQLIEDPASTKEIRKGIDLLLQRLSF